MTINARTPETIFTHEVIEKMMIEPPHTRPETGAEYSYRGRFFHTFEEIDRYRRWVAFHQEVTSEYVDFNPTNIVRWLNAQMENIHPGNRVKWCRELLNRYFPDLGNIRINTRLVRGEGDKGRKFNPQYDPAMAAFMRERQKRLHKETVCVVFPATYPGSKPDSHCTLVFLGKVQDFKMPREELQRIVDVMAVKITGGLIKTVRRSLFGPDHDLIVWELEPRALRNIRKWLDAQLAVHGVKSASEFQVYRPHVTVQKIFEPREPAMPQEVYLGIPVIWWGEDRPSKES